MIKTLSIPKLRNTEFLQFFHDVIDRCERYKLIDLKLDGPVNGLKESLEPLTEVLNKESGSALTEQLITSDGRRDSDIIGIRTVCEGYTYSRDAATAQAARDLLNSIDKHGPSISRMNYQAQSTVVDTILEAWDSNAGLTAALTLLQLNAWAQALKTENTTFKSVYQTRIDDKMVNSGDSFTELRTGVT